MHFALVIADDLTGANDTGIQFAKQGYRTLVASDWGEAGGEDGCEEFGEDPGEAGEPGRTKGVSADMRSGRVDVVNVDTRGLPEAAASRRIREAVDRLALQRYAYVYKKIDSTLRGYVAEEIDALLDSGEFDAALVAPAYPQQGRRTIGGYHFVGDQLLEDSAVANDPGFPMRESQLVRWLRGRSRRDVAHLDVDAIRRDCPAAIARQLNEGASLLVCDAVTETDLRELAASAIATGKRLLWVGSAGLAGALASCAKPGGAGADSPPILVVAGSVHPASRAQTEALAEAGYRLVKVDPLALLGDPDEAVERNAALTAEAFASAGAEGVVVTTEDGPALREELARRIAAEGGEASELGGRIAAGLGRIAAAAMSRFAPAGVILTGGEIASRTFRQLGIRRLEMVGEAGEGIPLCVAEGGRGGGPLFATKAGGFGGRDSLVRTAEAMKRRIHDRRG